MSLSKKETNKKYHIINLINKNKNNNKTTAKTIDLDNALTSKRTYLVKKQSNIGGLITAIDAVQYLPTNETPSNKAQFAFSQKLRKSLVQAEARVDAARAKIQVSLNHCIYYFEFELNLFLLGCLPSFLSLLLQRSASFFFLLFSTNFLLDCYKIGSRSNQSNQSNSR